MVSPIKTNETIEAVASEKKLLNGVQKTVDEPAVEGAHDDASSTISFHSEDSYELCVDGPDPATLRKRPEQVPPLDLGVIPGYESSSEESDEDESYDTEEEGEKTGDQEVDGS